MNKSSSSSTLKERAYAQIRRQIEIGELQRGTRISNRKRAKILGMSAIPVREAIAQLVSEGLLEHRPGIGTFVADPTRYEIEDIYELREVLESYAARRAARMTGFNGSSEMRHAIDLLYKIKEQYERDPSPEKRDRLYDQCGQADSSFHMAVLRRCGNQLAMKTVAGLRLMSRVFSRRAYADRVKNIDGIIKAHEEILTAIEAGDVKNAGRLMRRHIHAGRIRALKFYDQQHRNEEYSTVTDDAQLSDLHQQIEQLAHDIESNI
ncbi:MAG: GntR family transcriptional regulator [Phycisphaeraceae bacterium]|nr:GntR family transcriptional regulator [Phycisphaeraceae bacterium]